VRGGTAPRWLGLGTAPLGGLHRAVDEHEAVEAIERAWDLGIRFFDTAPYYGSGLAETRLGLALRGRPRAEFVVSTKVGRRLEPGSSSWHGAPPLRAYFDFSYDGALRSLEESLERLGLDEVDVALVHDPDDHYAEATSGAFCALRRLRDEGSVKRIGVGMNSSELLCRFAEESDPDCFLVAGRLTLLDRSATERLLPLCLERDIGLIVGGVFNSGILAGGTTFDYAQAEDEVAQRAERLEEIARRRGVPLAAAAVQFPTRYRGVETVLIGCASASEVEDDVRLAGVAVPSRLWSELE
jgi:aryl-alcohol dehydrogenase-like predicted oxidoreductase